MVIKIFIKNKKRGSMSIFTYGVEEEFIVVDKNYNPVDFDIIEIIKNNKNAVEFSNEIHKGVLEVKTKVCKTASELAESIRIGRKYSKEQILNQDKILLSCGTHPSANWQNIETHTGEYYDKVLSDYGAVAKSNYIFGHHLHIGLKDKDKIIILMNKLREYIPLFLALSCNSPLWRNHDTGLHSYRTRIFCKYPRTGIQEIYSNLEEYKEKVDWLLKTGCIKNKRSVWTDIRIHPVYETIEIRVMDVQTKVESSVGLSMFIVLLSEYLYNESIYDLKYLKKDIIEENKWRAARYGMNVEFIINDEGKKDSVKNILKYLIDDLKPYAIKNNVLEDFLLIEKKLLKTESEILLDNFNKYNISKELFKTLEI